MADDLVERVARRIAYNMGYTWGSRGLDHDTVRDAAIDAIAIAMEEAAQIAEPQVDDYSIEYYIRNDISAAIREMIPSGSGQPLDPDDRAHRDR